MPNLYLNSYGPLVMSTAGRAASTLLGIPPFVDGSIRREPDLEHQYPSISCLCRADRFAPRLRPDDVVVYLTKKQKYGAVDHPHRRLTAVLKVFRIMESHETAAEWYQSQGQPVPSNCMIDGNLAKPLKQSHERNPDRKHYDDDRLWRRWDLGYRTRSRKYPTFVICETLFRSLDWDAPIVEDEHLTSVFGNVPGTRNPGKLPLTRLNLLMSAIGASLQND